MNKILDIQTLGNEDKAYVFAMLDAFLQSQKAKKFLFSSIKSESKQAQGLATHFPPYTLAHAAFLYACTNMGIEL